jgi:type II secretory ATPase GspE/PulE/Tfp pilus assembly ATPase PilB-like protein
MEEIEKKNSQFNEELARGKDASIVKIVDHIVEAAHKSKASDIHIDPRTEDLRVRFRIDGVLQENFLLPKNIHNEIVSRIKVLSKLRTDEHQATQDGRFRHEFPENKEFIDLRVSVVPTYHGENVVLRILSDKAEQFSLESLGFSESDQKKIKSAIKKTSGMILVTGPTGSGKTTTLYTLVKMLNNPGRSIVTIEDPIEYAVSDIEQIQVNPKAGLTFASGLRSILRQDPNIIMVGEIRDSETAGIAVNTALTGHLLLSTLHTNDAPTTLPRLLDMGIEEYLVSSTVSLIIGQRLARKICEHCKEKVKFTKSENESLEDSPLGDAIEDDEIFYKGKGCDECNGSGYSGRICVNEVLVANEKIKEAILRKATALDIKKLAKNQGMTTMIEDGLHKVREGLTTFEEVLRVIHE